MFLTTFLVLPVERKYKHYTFTSLKLTDWIYFCPYGLIAWVMQFHLGWGRFFTVFGIVGLNFVREMVRERGTKKGFKKIVA